MKGRRRAYLKSQFADSLRTPVWLNNQATWRSVGAKYTGARLGRQTEQLFPWLYARAVTWPVRIRTAGACLGCYRVGPWQELAIRERSNGSAWPGSHAIGPLPSPRLPLAQTDGSEIFSPFISKHGVVATAIPANRPRGHHRHRETCPNKESPRLV